MQKISPSMKRVLTASLMLLFLGCEFAEADQAKVQFAGKKRLNNLVAELLDVRSFSKSGGVLSFARPSAGWVFVSATFSGNGTAKIMLDNDVSENALIVHVADDGPSSEAMRCVARGRHKLRLECTGSVRVDNLVVRAIPELLHCGLFDPAIKSYGHYDMDFLKKDVLPNITGLITPHNIQLSQDVIDDWHRQGKKFIAEVGVSAQAKKADDHFKHWTDLMDTATFADGIIIDEFIINKPETRPSRPASPKLQKEMNEEQQRHHVYEEAFRQMYADPLHKEKTVYAFIGGSGKTLNQECIGPSFVRTLMDCKVPIALERYIFERSSEQRSHDALREFSAGIADWRAKEHGVMKNLVLAFGLFSMPPGGINKLPNVDYHVWMDQQMEVVANDPVMRDLRGLTWWTSALADEETVRFVGKLYRHYAIEGKKDRLTRDPLFLTHIQNADFEKGTEGWTLQPAEEGAIQAQKFPRYGRIEGRYMGLGRPADPEHIGDTFLVMKRSAKGPNAFSQTIKDLEPGRLYSMKMFTSDYIDLLNPKARKVEEANEFMGSVILEGADVDTTRSFTEMYASNPEPKIPVWINYHWKVFRAKGTTAKMIVSDWNSETKPTDTFCQEQTFNFVEIQPYHE